MNRRPPRFVHTSDWHLERPPSGLAEIPERLRAKLIDAPYLAAERVVDAALTEEADFLVLSGDVLDVELAGPRGVAFVLEQFSRLRQRGVSVYWAGGRVDRPTRWPAAIKLPDNVRFFSQRRPEAIVHHRDDEPLAHVIGVSRHRKRAVRADAFLPAADGLPALAVAHGPIDRTALTGRPLTYWALGGKHGRVTISAGSPTAHYCGTPQARTAGEAGSHGCTVVELDEDGQATTRFVATDIVRWSSQQITIDAAATRESLLDSLVERLASLTATAAADIEWLVVFKVSGHGPLIAALRDGAWPAELLQGLRRRAPANVWPVSLDLDSAAAVPPAWVEHDSILGEFLRSLGELGADDDVGLATRLESYLDEPRRASEIGRLVALADGADRLRLLRQSAALAAGWLGGEEVRS